VLLLGVDRLKKCASISGTDFNIEFSTVRFKLYGVLFNLHIIFFGVPLD
jgi:hypothetical protein